jgi:release factor glutamine methyltransferase
VNLDAVVDRLTAAGCVAAEAEAQQLVAGAPDPVTLDAWVRRREAGEPPAWITGTVDFCGRPMRIDPGVYVPRPQTEVLARHASRLLPPHGRAVDLCTGSGAIAAHLRAEAPTASVVGVDVDAVAARCARSNGVLALVGDLGSALRDDATVDVVTAVAPYVPTDDLAFLPADVTRYEPRRALDGGGDGLTVVRRVIADAARLLRPGGWLLVEVGGAQDAAIVAELTEWGFTAARPWRDHDGDLRGLAARASGRGR